MKRYGEHPIEVAILIGIVVSWLISSLWPIALLISLAALILFYRGQRLAQYFELLIPQLSYPLKTVYEFNLELADQLWNTLKLTSEERVFVDANPVRHIRLVAEEWGESLTRVKIAQSSGALPRSFERGGFLRDLPIERTVDVYPRPSIWMDLWQIKLGNDPGAPYISLNWGGNTVRLCAWGDRFEKLDGYEPGTGLTLFDIPIPFLKRADRQSENYKRYQEPMQKFRTFDVEFRGKSDPSKGGTGIDCRWYEFYRCDNFRDKGFKWTLERRDLRDPLAATVVRIHKLWNREVVGFTLRLDQLSLGWPRLKIWAPASVVENDCVGQNTLHKGEVVFLDLGEKLEADRIMPLRNYYTPAKCPQCKKRHWFTMPEYFPFHSDGVCTHCRPPKHCSRCHGEFDPKFLREEHGELVCSSDRCKEVSPVCEETLDRGSDRQWSAS